MRVHACIYQPREEEPETVDLGPGLKSKPSKTMLRRASPARPSLSISLIPKASTPCSVSPIPNVSFALDTSVSSPPRRVSPGLQTQSQSHELELELDDELDELTPAAGALAPWDEGTDKADGDANDDGDKWEGDTFYSQERRTAAGAEVGATSGARKRSVELSSSSSSRGSSKRRVIEDDEDEDD